MSIRESIGRMSKRKSFWTTLPGVLTGIAAAITAITGLYWGITKVADQRFVIMREGYSVVLSQGVFASSTECGERIAQLSDPHNEYCLQVPKAVFCFESAQYVAETRVNTLECFLRIEPCRGERDRVAELNALEAQASGRPRETEDKCAKLSFDEAMARLLAWPKKRIEPTR